MIQTIHAASRQKAVLLFTVDRRLRWSGLWKMVLSFESAQVSCQVRADTVHISLSHLFTLLPVGLA